MTVDNSSACLRRFNGIIGNLLWTTRDFLASILCPTRTCQCSGDKNLFAHRQWHSDLSFLRYESLFQSAFFVC
jgi:hypothetical protein